MQCLCTECNYIGIPKGKTSDLYLAEKLFWAFTILFFVFGIITIWGFIFFVIMLAFSFVVSLTLRTQKNKQCPKCDNMSLIPLNTPKAQELIKTHNLVVPEEPIETSKPKAPWQTS
jgi:hypothetical protein